MMLQFISLEWKSFIRAASFQTNLAMKILMGFGALYFMAVFLGLGVGVFFIIEDMELGDPFEVVNRYMIYYLAFDMLFRYSLQKMPVTNIKPFLYVPLTKNQVVRFSLLKTVVSFFNWSHAFFFLPFSIVLISKDYPAMEVLFWHLGMAALIYANNYINVLINNMSGVFYTFVATFVALGAAHFFGWFDVTLYTAPFFDLLGSNPLACLIPLALLGVLSRAAFGYFRTNMYLDAGLATKQEEASTQEYAFLNRFGNLGTFIKNDIRLILRNKRSKMALYGGLFFLFYGLLFFTGAIEVYDGPVWKIFAGIFVSGGFLFNFGQFVPSWDSAYYPLMMSQNIKYQDYIKAKWYLIVIATAASMLLAIPYLYFGLNAYLAVLVGGIYNIGINGYLVLWGGAYIKTPIDLASGKKAFGDKQSFNAKTLLLTVPKILLPLAIYWVVALFASETLAFASVAFAGVLGYLFRNKVFSIIEKVYKDEKYKTLAAYKQTP
ncbi:MAG: hypothetical protein HN860_05110 [Flavobacteriaceae bacterium]|nr:hypothetical protein [Flavobacteriaceae bacterium]